METVAQGATYSDLTAPILDASGTAITDGANDITVTLLDANDDDQSTGITIAHSSGGRYRITKTLSGSAVTGAWGGTVVYDDGVNPVRTQTIDFTVITSAQADPAGALSGATLTYSGPVSQTGVVTIVRGDDYLVADGRELLWSWTDAESMADLTGATIAFVAQSEAFQQRLAATGAVVDPSGATKSVRVELTSVQTSDISEEATGTKIAWTYVLRATLASTTVATLATGPMRVLSDNPA